MASPIGNLIHPPESRSDLLPHSYPHPPPHPNSNPNPHPHQHPHPNSHPQSHHPHPHPHLHPHPHPHSYSTPTQSHTLPGSHQPPPAPSTLAPLITTPSPSSVPGPNPLPPSGAPPTPQSAASTTDTASNSTPQFPRGHSNTQSLYQCADCLRRYSRPEHLQRHIATHTLGKRFTCDICSKAFSRADLLKRHRANHQDDNGNKRRRITSSPGAGRVAHACQACAKARVKCEDMKPCKRCKTRGINCEFATPEDAAMHLLHLSGNVGPSGYSHQGSPESSYSLPPPPPPPPATTQHQFQPPPPDLSLSSYSPHSSSQVVNQSPVLPSNPPTNEESQLPTPETLMDQNNSDGFQPPYPGNDMVDVSRLPFTDFLRDVLYDQSLSHPAKLAEAQGLAVLDFCDNTNLDLKDIDFGLLDHWNLEGLPGGDPSVPIQSNQANNVDIAAMRTKLVKMWTESPWRWNPGKTDTCYTEQSNLPLPTKDITGTTIGASIDRVISEKLHSSGRDRILGIVLSTCRNNSTMTRVAASFPSTETMDSWIHIFLASHLCSISAWIHYGSFILNNRWPEWLAMAAAAGAVLAPIPALRRFGFALQEAVRVTIPNRFEEENSKIADIVPVQALVMVQDVGLWSGNRRKMEIAECHLTVPIAMMRYRGKFQRSSYPNVVLEPGDEGEVLEEKWRRWYELESWKRLVFHAYLRDAQVSMTQLCNPHMSYAELTLPLPCPKELWFARTAEEFKTRYLEIAAANPTIDNTKRPPSLGDLLRDINLLSANHARLDVQYAISIYLHGFWSLIWEFRQLNVVLRPSSPSTANHTTNPNILLSTRHQELVKLLATFQLATSSPWQHQHQQHEMMPTSPSPPPVHPSPSAQEHIVLHLLLLHLHVSLDDLQLFSGKEGEEQARRVYPVLQRWAGGYEARVALWHAGQILRQAKGFPGGHLKDFCAVAVHHAALCVWTFGVVVKAGRGRGGQERQKEGEGVGVVYLDGEESEMVRGYLQFGTGRAAIRGVDGYTRSGHGHSHSRQQMGQQQQQQPIRESLIEDSEACMEIAQEILRANFVRDGGRSGGSDGLLPPISENIVLLLKQLGGAAGAVGLG